MPSRVERIQAKIDRGMGKAASIYGTDYSVYRLGPKSEPSGVITKASLITASVNVSFERLGSKADVEIDSLVKFLAFTGVMNLKQFLPGDVFVQNVDAYRYDRGVFTAVSMRPMPHDPVFISTPIFATFSRPESNPQHIDSGRVPQSVPIKGQEWPLTMQGGDFVFQPTGTPVTVPVGMILGRLRDMPKTDSTEGQLWDDTRRQEWSVFVPLLGPSQTNTQPLIPRDIMTGMNGDRYEIGGVQSSTASFFGQLLTVSRIRS